VPVHMVMKAHVMMLTSCCQTLMLMPVKMLTLMLIVMLSVDAFHDFESHRLGRLKFRLLDLTKSGIVKASEY
jgi:hypothetical protein